MSFAVGTTYTRQQVQELAGVPDSQRNGSWDTGYTPFGGQLYVFCNVGSAGRTGHDYDNRWDGDELVWYAKTGTHIRQPLMQSIARGATPVHLFWRADSSKPEFRYEGLATARQIEDTTPVQLRWTFDRKPPAVAPTSNATAPTTLRTLLGGDGRLFAKSEFGPASEGWPAVSFSRQADAADLAQTFRRGRDFLLFVGTTNPNATVDPGHRSMVLSAVTFEPKAPISTNQIVPEASWRDAVAKWGVRWEWSLPITEAYDFVPLLTAREAMPRTYTALGTGQARGRAIEVAQEDLAELLDRPIARVPLQVREAVRGVMAMNSGDVDLRKAMSQMAMGIQQRIENSGQERLGHHPVRKGPNLSDIITALNTKWAEQKGRCLLCGEPMVLKPANRLLQPSPDRIDSDEKTYDPENLHLTHLGCNLAKSSASMDHWAEYLAVIRIRTSDPSEL